MYTAIHIIYLCRYGVINGCHIQIDSLFMASFRPHEHDNYTSPIKINLYLYRYTCLGARDELFLISQPSGSVYKVRRTH